MPASAKAYIFLIITNLGWAANSVIGKFAVGHVSPMLLTLSRWSVALVVIVLISLPQLRRDWPQIRQHWLLLFGYGAFGFAAYNALLYSAVQYTSAINSVIETAGIPGLIFIGNYLLFRTRVGMLQIIGYTVTLSGVALTAAHGSFGNLLDLTFNIGDVLMLLTCVVYAIYTVALKWKPSIHWKSLMAATAAGALVASIPLVAWEISTDRFIAPDEIGWLTILFTGLVPSLVSQILFVRGVELIGANRAGLFINTIPVFGTLMSVFLLGESFQNFHILALAMVLGGIAIAERGRA